MMQMDIAQFLAERKAAKMTGDKDALAKMNNGLDSAQNAQASSQNKDSKSEAARAMDMLKSLSKNYGQAKEEVEKEKAQKEAEQNEKLAKLQQAGLTVRGVKHDYDEDDAKGLRAVFDMFDSKESGGIPIVSLGTLLQKLGVSATDEEIAHAKKEFDADGNGVLDFEEFLDMVHQLQAFQAKKEEILMHDRPDEEVQACKAVFDTLDRSATGSITEADLQECFEKIGNPQSDSDISKMVETFDSDGNGTIEFDEFMGMLECLTAQAAGDEDKVKEIMKRKFDSEQQEKVKGNKARAAGIAAGKSVYRKGGTIKEVEETAALAAKVAGATEDYIQQASAQARKNILVDLNGLLEDCAKKGNLEDLEECLERGAEATWQNPKEDGRTALQVACDNNNPDCAEELIDHGADVNYVNERGYATIYFAAGHRDPKCVMLLIEHGALVTTTSSPDSTTALSRACIFGNAASAKLLIENSANIDHQDSKGVTPLMLACNRGDWECVKCLAIDNSAEINIQDTKGNTALDMTILANHEDLSIMEMLLRNGATCMSSNARKIDKSNLQTDTLNALDNMEARKEKDKKERETNKGKLPDVQPSPRGQAALDGIMAGGLPGPVPSKAGLAPVKPTAKGTQALSMSASVPNV